MTSVYGFTSSNMSAVIKDYKLFMQTPRHSFDKRSKSELQNLTMLITGPPPSSYGIGCCGHRRMIPFSIYVIHTGGTLSPKEQGAGFFLDGVIWEPLRIMSHNGRAFKQD